MITLTTDQARLVLAALDVTVKTHGLATSPAIFTLAADIERQMTAETQPPAEQ